MTDHSLRAALKEACSDAHERGRLKITVNKLNSLLAAHPAEPAWPLPNRAAVRAAIADTQDRRGSFVRDFMDPEDIDRMAARVLALLNGAES